VPPTDRPFIGGLSNDPDTDKNGRRTTPAYYRPATTSLFVRADVTYIRQDFSVPLAVKIAGGSSAMQRFDFVVRERPINSDSLTEKLAAHKPNAIDLSSPHKKALLFALRELTGAGAPPETR
jgi:hypothetical protein